MIFYPEFYGFLSDSRAAATAAQSLLNCKYHKRRFLIAAAGAAELNARLTEGFTDAEIDIVARWLTSMQQKFPKGENE